MSDWKLLNTSTASGAANTSFTALTGYKIFKFVFIDINPDTDQYLTINFSSDGGLNYNMTKTTTFFESYHYENDTGSGLIYQAGWDLAQSTAGQPISEHTGATADNCMAGELHLFNPSSTTYVKHFYSTVNNLASAGISQNAFVGGYVNSTSAVNAVQFAMSSGNFDGIIKLYGIGG